SIREQHCRHGLIAVVELCDQLSGAFNFFNVDLADGDALFFELTLQPRAISAPRRAEHGDGACFGYELCCGGHALDLRSEIRYFAVPVATRRQFSRVATYTV